MADIGELRILVVVTDKASSQLKNMSASAETYRKKMTGIKDGTKKASQATDLYTSANQRLARSMKTKLMDAQNGVIKNNKTFLSNFTHIRWAIVNVTMVIGLMSMAMTKIIGTAAEFGMKIAQVGMITNTTFEEANEAIQNLREDTIFSLEDVAEALVEVSRRGFDFAEAAEVMSVSTDLAVVGFVDLNQAMDVITTTMRQFFMDVEDAAHIAAVLANVSLDTAADLGNLQTALSNVGPVAFSMGISLEELSATMGLLHDAGIRGSKAGTSMRQMLLALGDPSGEASKKLKMLGVSAFDAEGNFKGLSNIINQLAFVFRDSGVHEEVEALSTVFRRRAAPAIAALVEKVKENPAVIEDMTNALDESVQSVGSMVTELDSYALSVKLLSAEFKEAGTDAASWITKWGSAIGGAFSDLNRTRSTQMLLSEAIKDGTITYQERFDMLAKTRKALRDDSYWTGVTSRALYAEIDARLIAQKAMKDDIITLEDLVTIRQKLDEATDQGKLQILKDVQVLIIQKEELMKVKDATDGAVESTLTYAQALENAGVVINAASAAEQTIADFMLKGNNNIESKIKSLKEEAEAVKEEIKVSRQASLIQLLGNDIYQDRINLIDEYVDATINAWEEEERLKNIQAQVTEEQKQYKQTLKDNKHALKDVRTEIKGLNEELAVHETRIKTLSSQRFTGETAILGLIDKLEIYIKKQKLADLGIADSQAFLQEQIGRSTDSMGDLITNIETVNSLTTQGQKAYEAWRESIETAIRAEVMAGGELEKDVTNRIRVWQTQLLGIYAMQGQSGTTPEEDQLNKLQLAYDVYYGGQHDNVRQFLMEEEDKKNGVAESSEGVISALSNEWVAIDGVNSKLADAVSKESQLEAQGILLQDHLDSLGVFFSELAGEIKDVGKELDILAVKMASSMGLNVNTGELASEILGEENPFAEVFKSGRSLNDIESSSVNPFAQLYNSTKSGTPLQSGSSGSNTTNNINVEVGGSESSGEEIARAISRELQSF